VTRTTPRGDPHDNSASERSAPEATADLLAALASEGGIAPRARLLGLVEGFARARVLVIGDLVLDEYLIGTPARISREAPVLILEQRDQFIVPGGATNPGVNARTLGAEVYVAGVIGDDSPGRQLQAALARAGVHLDGVLRDASRPTSTKTRIVAGSAQVVQQQIVRIDRVAVAPLSAEQERDIIAAITRLIPQVDAVILSDYDIGMLSPAIIAACLPLARQHHVNVVVDSHGDLARFQGVTALTPNEPEAEAALGVRITDRASLDRAGGQLLAQTGARGVLITRGSEGMSLFERDQPPVHLPVAPLILVSDTTGAGDTVCATFTLALVAGATMAEAAVLATLAAGLVVRRMGCATNTPAELAAAINDLVGA
jgi:rfaE bifunctional protein kinase chain/domain